MIVFHGTSNYVLPMVQENGLLLYKYNHVKRKCACTSLELKAAQLFAIRRTSSDDFMAGKITGIVLEFEINGQAGRDYEEVKDRRSLQDEKEVAVYSPKCLSLIASWSHEKQWCRHPLDV